MRVDIGKIKVAERLRKEVVHLDELAENIREHGLICPIAVMKLNGGGGETFQLLAGLRRLRAMEMNGETEIEANIVTAADAEAALKIEFSENEQREQFTFTEKMDYARLIEDIEKAKAKERMSEGGKGGLEQGGDRGPHLPEKPSGRSREFIGAKIGLSGRQYSRAKFIANNAPPEVLDDLDSGEKSIRGAYNELYAAKKREQTAEESTVAEDAATENVTAETDTFVSDVTEPSETETGESAAVFEVETAEPPTDDELPKAEPQNAPEPPAPKKEKPRKPSKAEFDEVQASRDAFVSKYAEADHKRGILETQLHNTNLQWQSEREGKDGRIAELTAALETANARIKELEAALEAANAKIMATENSQEVTFNG